MACSHWLNESFGLRALVWLAKKSTLVNYTLSWCAAQYHFDLPAAVWLAATGTPGAPATPLLLARHELHRVNRIHERPSTFSPVKFPSGGCGWPAQPTVAKPIVAQPIGAHAIERRRDSPIRAPGVWASCALYNCLNFGWRIQNFFPFLSLPTHSNFIRFAKDRVCVWESFWAKFRFLYS
jgi:hypothetical protein